MVQKANTRPRRYRIDVWATEDELKRIDANAKACGLSRSSYLRNLGEHYQPKSVYDAKAIHEIIKTRADMGRLGGLLKLWLSGKSGECTAPIKVRNVLREIESCQSSMSKLILEKAKMATSK